MNSTTQTTENGAAAVPPHDPDDTDRLDWLLCFVDGTEQEETERRFRKIHEALSLGYRGREALDVAMRMVFADDMSDDERERYIAEAKAYRVILVRDHMLGTDHTAAYLAEKLECTEARAQELIDEAGIVFVGGEWEKNDE